MFYTKLFRGWVYFILGSVMVLLTAWMVTNANRPNPEPDGSIANETTTPQPPAETVDPPEAAEVAEAPSAENETGAKQEDQPASGEEVATRTPDPAQPAGPLKQDQPMVAEPKVVDEAGPAPTDDPANVRPATPPPQQTEVPTTPVVSRVNCDFLISPPPPETGYNDGYAWSVSAETPMNAVFSGAIVKISESPYTGTTVYQVNETGTWCAVYGGVGELLVTEGDMAPCGSRIGLSAEKVYLSALTLKPGEDWWRGKPASVKALFK